MNALGLKTAEGTRVPKYVATDSVSFGYVKPPDFIAGYYNDPAGDKDRNIRYAYAAACYARLSSDRAWEAGKFTGTPLLAYDITAPGARKVCDLYFNRAQRVRYINTLLVEKSLINPTVRSFEQRNVIGAGVPLDGWEFVSVSKDLDFATFCMFRDIISYPYVFLSSWHLYRCLSAQGLKVDLFQCWFYVTTQMSRCGGHFFSYFNHRPMKMIGAQFVTLRNFPYWHSFIRVKGATNGATDSLISAFVKKLAAGGSLLSPKDLLATPRSKFDSCELEHCLDPKLAHLNVHSLSAALTVFGTLPPTPVVTKKILDNVWDTNLITE